MSDAFDNQNWIQIVQTLSPPLYRFFHARFGRQRAEEYVQEVFLRLLTKTRDGSFDLSRGSFDALGWGIALNVQHEGFRQKSEVADPASLAAASIESNQEVLDTFSDLRLAVNQLSEPSRTVMQMVLADTPLEQIATTLALPEGTVKSHVHRAKILIREFLSSSR